MEIVSRSSGIRQSTSYGQTQKRSECLQMLQARLTSYGRMIHERSYGHVPARPATTSVAWVPMAQVFYDSKYLYLRLRYRGRRRCKLAELDQSAIPTHEVLDQDGRIRSSASSSLDQLTRTVAHSMVMKLQAKPFA